MLFKVAEIVVSCCYSSRRKYYRSFVSGIILVSNLRASADVIQTSWSMTTAQYNLWKVVSPLLTLHMLICKVQ